MLHVTQVGLLQMRRTWGSKGRITYFWTKHLIFWANKWTKHVHAEQRVSKRSKNCVCRCNNISVACWRGSYTEEPPIEAPPPSFPLTACPSLSLVVALLRSTRDMWEASVPPATHLAGLTSLHTPLHRRATADLPLTWVSGFRKIIKPVGDLNIRATVT